MFFATVLNNLPELVMGLFWSIGVFYFGMRFGRWRAKRAARI